MAHNITFSPDAWADYLYWLLEQLIDPLQRFLIL